MLTIDQILLFSATALVLIFTPGPDILQVLTRGVAQGRSAGLAAAAGFSLGNVFHTTLVALGIAAVLASSDIAFTVIKMGGAAYLVYVGIQILRSGAELPGTGKLAVHSPTVVFRQSLIANVLNPKVAIFFLALFPQFIRNNNTSPTMQIILLGMVFIILSFASFSLVAICAGKVNNVLQTRPAVALWSNRLAGSILLALGLSLAFS